MPAQSSLAPHGRVLIVDDNHDYADSLRELVELSTDWEPETAYGVPEAIAKVQSRRPDAVLLDLDIPPSTGFQAADALERAFPDNPPVLFAVSGNVDLVRAAANDRRFTRALLKPADPGVLMSWLNEISVKSLRAAE